MIYYVNAAAAKSGDGSKAKPFSKIQQAAKIAEPGDEVVVAPGIYREWVNPKNGGTEKKRIVYRSEKPLEAHITGAEELKNWKKVSGSVYTARVSNKIFGSYNPYTTLVSGDWFVAFMTAHTGDVFLNGKSMYEVQKLSQVKKPEVYIPSWDQEFTKYVWYTEQDEKTDETVFYANFQDKDPNEENIEITARQACFYPEKEGRGFITLSGFTVSQAATQWAPPTAYQEGMIGPHWSKGWIIEDCEVYESKCSGISLGKYCQPNNDNKWLKWKFKDGTQTERDCICQAQTEGWSKENIGSHIVRRCNIHDCGQTGIVGHLGGVFSLIEDNHIHHINNKQNLAGAEIGGIKMHAAIDCIYRRNHIHHCTRGIWLDWQAQGTRVTQNFFHDNVIPKKYNENKESMGGCAEDLFIEVSHGPTLVDNNIFLSDKAIKLATQGVAMVHNIIAGSFVAVGLGTNNGSPNKVSPRYTPYHMPHRTEVAGFMTILHGDCKFYNNIFIQQKMRPALKAAMLENEANHNDWDDGNIKVGTFKYDKYPTYEKWVKMFDGYCGMGSVTTDRYYSELPVWAGGNVYFNGAKPMKQEKDAVVDKTSKVTIGYEEKDGKILLKTNLYEVLPETACKLMHTDDIMMAFEPEEKYENPDGSPITFDTDFSGKKRSGAVLPGCFADKAGIDAPLF
ncbi:MAG: right-handed parallel beta-helix repeat-containing protein [Spirochaetaceae bacterium]|nr:right-handed parallel beta-helix repeat-containing protein [Spirochaetaceae bacterium]